MEMSRKKRRRRRLLLIVPLLVLTGLVLLVELHLSPYIRELARNQAVNAASNAIIEAVSEMLRRGDTDFSRVIVLEKDVEGHITALRTDMTQVERLKVEVLELLDTLVAQINTQQMGIPLGNLLLPDLLAGTGPELPVKAVSLTMSNADFFSDFTAAGINQTLQTLKVKFTISLTILTTVGYETVDVYAKDDVDYDKYSGYDESYKRGEGYSLESYNNISGSGFDVKMGLILRPFEYSPFRIGFAVHTPTFYKLTYSTSAIVTNDYRDAKTDELKRIIVDTYDYVGDMKRDYRLVTPWKYNVSLGYTVGTSLALGAEYEYEDYSTMKFKYSSNDGGGDMEFENAEVKNCLKGEHTFRIGAEYKVIPEFAFRLGYNYSSAVFRDEAVKYIPSNSLITDTDFSNKRSQSNYTLGIGYRGKMFYADLAYQLSTYKENFYPFYNEFELTQGEWTMVTPPATKVTNTRSQVLLTVGMRF